MNKRYRPSAATALFATATLVACHGVGAGLNPPELQQSSAESASQAAPPAIVCKAPPKDSGTALIYSAAGNVKGTTFEAVPGKFTAGWILWKIAKVKPTPTPNPTPTPKTKPVSFYVYYGTYAMKNKQTGCAVLETTVSGKPIKGLTCTCNGLTDGVTKLKPSYALGKEVANGFVSSLIISHLSAKGGSGSVKLATPAKKPYTTGTITLIGRVVIKMREEQPLFDSFLQDR